jgi:hypothetical protein
VHDDAGYASLLGRDLDGPQDIARVARRAQLGGEHQVVVGPRIACRRSFALLFGTVCPQHGDQGSRQRHRTP